jgi:hypothetical protein
MGEAKRRGREPVISDPRKLLLEAAIDSELSRHKFHCANCRRLIRDRAISLSEIEEAWTSMGETFESLLPYMACYQVKLSIKVQGLLNTYNDGVLDSDSGFRKLCNETTAETNAELRRRAAAQSQLN